MLANDAVELWYVRTERVEALGRLSASEAALDCTERSRASAYLRRSDRTLFVAARALARTVLSRHAAVEPDAWRFRVTAFGKPEIDGPAIATGLHFSLAHTAGLCACAVARHPVGADVERADRAVSADLAASCLAPAELAAWARRAPAERTRLFLGLWVLKEAYMKARGMGLRLAPDAIEFVAAADGTATAAFRGGIDDNPAAWGFRHFLPTGTHLAAVAVRHPAPMVVVRELDPEAMP